jgi:glycine cleavage system H lipoate-binding protein
MNNINQHGSFSQTANANLKECWWMQAGVVDYKLCDRDYDCEHCPFDQVLNGRVTTPVSNSPAFSAAGPIERDWSGRGKKSRKDAAGDQGSDAAGALFYHPAHTWARVEDGGCVRTGLDDFALRILGRPYLITLPEPGATLRFGEGCWHFTHQAGVTVLVAPVSGRVKEINPALAERPTLLNRDPYGEGWVLLIEPTDLQGCLQRLLYGPKVTQWYERECEKLNEKVSELTSRSGSPGPTMNDGGSLNKDFMKELAADQLRQVIDSFFPLSLVEKAETNKAILVKHGGESW